MTVFRALKQRTFLTLWLGQTFSRVGDYIYEIALAWWVRQRTTVSLRWLSEHLVMGHWTRVSQAVSRVKRRPDRKLAGLRRRLERLDRE